MLTDSLASVQVAWALRVAPKDPQADGQSRDSVGAQAAGAYAIESLWPRHFYRKFGELWSDPDHDKNEEERTSTLLHDAVKNGKARLLKLCVKLAEPDSCRVQTAEGIPWHVTAKHGMHGVHSRPAKSR